MPSTFSIKNKSKLMMLAGAMALVLEATPALGQAPVIASFGRNGELVCTNLQPGTVASVEWASAVTGPWTNNWAGLDAVTVDSSGMIQVRVPMFYRVRGFGRGTNSSPSGMALIPAGYFMMGDTLDGTSDALPLHSVYVSAFYMDKYEVTKALWDEVMGWNGGNGYSYDSPCLGKAANHPVQTVSWYDVVKWCNARSEKEGRTPAYYTDVALTQVYKTGQAAPYVKWNAGYRLPTEAEWEKAARGGASGHRFPWADTDNITHSMANYYSSSSYTYDTSPTRGYHPTFATNGTPYTSPVGYFAPNGYGLYDMAGNVWEWCWDRYGAYSSGSQTDPRGSTSGSGRVLRGGGWYGNAFFYYYGYAFYCRAAYRDDYDPSSSVSNLGFRAVLPPGQ